MRMVILSLRRRSTVGLLAGLLTVLALGARPTAGAEDRRLTLEPVRSRWPVGREAAGQWGVVGETVAMNRMSRPVAIRSVRFKVMGATGQVLADRRFEGNELADVLLVFGRMPDGTPIPRPAGTTSLLPGDTAVAFLASLAGPLARPRHAEVAMRFRGCGERRTVVPLFAFDTGQRLRWPLGPAQHPWVAINTAGTPTHGRAILPTEQELFISQRFAIDTVQVDSTGNSSSPPLSPRREDYYAWGSDVLSAGRGRVVAVVNHEPDQEVGASDPEHPGGNYVVVEHAPGLYSFYAHLMQGSATVEPGNDVERGQILGKIGNSGNTTEPHLHVHLMDRWDALHPVLSIYTSQGLPALFWDARVLRNGQVFPLRRSTPLELDLIQPLDGGSAVEP